MYELTKFVTDIACPNHWEGRNGYKPIAYVIHRPEGTLPGVIDYLNDPATQKSYHFIIGLNGNVYQLVDPDNGAWHTGVVANPTWRYLIDNVNPNYYTIGISLEGFAADPFPKAQLVALYQLIADLESKYNCGIDEDTIVFHREIDADKSCPGFHIKKGDIITGSFLASRARMVADKAGM